MDLLIPEEELKLKKLFLVIRYIAIKNVFFPKHSSEASDLGNRRFDFESEW